MTSFQRSGLHIDLRIQIPPIDALFRIAERAAANGLTALLVEWEATYPFENHPLIPNRFSYTRKEVQRFLKLCQKLGLEVIPLQQSFGHLEYILQHDRYAKLRESQVELSQICPGKTREAEELFAELFRDVAASHSSPFLHIGGDETYLLGKCPECHERAKKIGHSALYTEYVNKMVALAQRVGKRPIIWADMLLKHPEAAADLSRSVILMDWNYGWEPHRNLKKFQALGFEIWGAAALRSGPDNRKLISWKKHFNNLRDYIPFAKRKKFSGIFMTSWSTSGVYTMEWDQSRHPVEMYPIRRVYPMGGFDFLLRGFGQAISSEAEFDPQAFFISYAQSSFKIS